MKVPPVCRLQRSIAVAVATVCLSAASGCGSSVADLLERDRYQQVAQQAEQDFANTRRRFQEQVQAVRNGAATQIKVEDPGIEDSDLATLEDLHGLTELSLPAACVSDAGLRHLKSLPAMEVLVLGDTTCNDEACATFAGLKNLRTLNLNASHITNIGLAHLKNLPWLENLRLGSSRITEIAALSSLPKLRFLILQNAAIHDEALAKFNGFEHLESLYIEGNPVTDDGIAALMQHRPQLHVHW